MKTKILTIDGKSKGEIVLPKIFYVKIREDIVQKVLEAKKEKQPYGPSPVAGRQYSARGKIVHKRHVWKSQYGKGMSRVPRKIMSRRGSQFRWEGASSPNTKGGLRAHPPKPESMINTKKINKKEMKIAFESALSAVADKKFIEKKYSTITKLERDAPFVVESKFTELKMRDLVKSLRDILGEEIMNVAVKKKKIRAGKGKLRGRKHKISAGALIVVGKDEKLKTTMIDVANVSTLKVEDLAKGGLGRLTIFTESAVKFLGEKK